MYVNNRKPIDRTKYVLESDPREVDRMRREEYAEMAKIETAKLTWKHDEMDMDPDYSDKTSSTSCNICDIKDFIFGAVNSRFWILRKHFNSMTTAELPKMPFFSWQCITLVLENRDVDLVITDQREMDDFLKFLIHGMCTIDG